ncbi:16S rRNA pseudouridine(516) synthase RsuA [Vibrio alfacsensis]|uniref:16S rRNA pseudouridine(516) synthase RsuA n=1 Tax=Vibrio alfacsensis TaxID=1074311 RepID=UPI002ADE303F|nr:16S rRNA pseudouridine(516) synthase RsuA [Vibrio alfacsensis]WQE75156.1 16S rRNA pseudouridine(516) synthase RsuA [Vibrio alfacsensis]
MRLDKYLCDGLGVTRKQATKVIRSGEVTVDGEVQKSGAFKVPENSVVEWDGRKVGVPGPRYIMLYKPADFVCSHEDGFNQTAFVLLDEPKVENLHFAGRLDVDTTGLVLITDDGQWSHRITSPKHKCEKTYRVWLADAIEPDYVEKFAQGIELRNERDATLPAQLEIVNEAENEVLLTIVEGKYHQVKRMFAALGNKVDYLHRERIGSIVLDEALEPGDYRYLTEEEVETIWK